MATKADAGQADRAQPVATAGVARIGRHSGKKLGDLLLELGTLTQEQLDSALAEQTQSGRRLGEIFVESGFLTEAELLQTLSKQLDLPLIDLRKNLPTEEALAALPEHLVRSRLALPMRVAKEGLAVAMPGPPSADVLAELEAAAGTRVSIVLAPTDDIQRLIDRSYRATAGMDRIVQAFRGDGARTTGAPGLQVEDNAPVVQVVQRILTEAVRERASDVHIEPQNESLRVRFRIDGALHDAVTLPTGMAQALVSRIKIMADLNIVERRRPQDGQFEATVDGRTLDVRVATTATIWGEKAVLRLLDRTRTLLSMDRLGMSPETRTQFSKMIRTPFGMVICAGPTGSGKTTTLYAALNEINDSAKNITTIEDPVEYVFPTINQIQINEQAEITFANGLRSILRQDPDVILVGEIRDVETARIAVQSALTGHFVLSSLHATDSTAALHRFVDMGLEPFLIASSVIGVVAQRLVRRTCTACREPYEPSAEELAIYDEWGGKPKDAFTHGVGCNFCVNTGYVDRVGVYELLPITAEIRDAVVHQGTHDEIREIALKQGMKSLRDEALRLVEQDVTTIAEVVRTIYVV